MKKYFLLPLLLALVPNMVFGASARFTQLVREKQRKMEQLEKCMGTNKGLKIAGISTLGLTAVGVAANIAEAKTIKDNEKTIEKKNEKIESLNAEIARKQEAKNKQKDVVEEAHVTPEVNTDFKTLCEAESFNGTFNVNAIPKEQTSGTGQVVEINVPVLAACTLSGGNNTEDKCKELVQKCANPRAYHYNSGTGVCACLGDAEAKCLNGDTSCKSWIKSNESGIISKDVNTDQFIESEEKCLKLKDMQPGTECYQDSTTGKWKIRWTVKEGDACPISECFDKTNTATCKYVWVPSAFVCVADTCKEGYKVFGHMCQKAKQITCDETKGEIVSVSGDECIKCAKGLIAKNGKCEQKQNVEDVSTNKTAKDLQTCKTKVRFAGGQKWGFGKAVENNFRDMASSYELAVEDDTEIYNNHKTMVYQEIFATKKQEIDAFVIPNEQGRRWSCNGITINSDSCAGKTYKECFNPFYECKLDNAKMLAESEAENKYIEALTQSICYVKSL